MKGMKRVIENLDIAVISLGPETIRSNFGIHGNDAAPPDPVATVIITFLTAPDSYQSLVSPEILIAEPA